MVFKSLKDTITQFRASIYLFIIYMQPYGNTQDTNDYENMTYLVTMLFENFSDVRLPPNRPISHSKVHICRQ